MRGTPALLLYRGVLGFRDRAALAVFSATGLPLIVAITTIAVEEGHMRSATAASLVGAGILSTAILPDGRPAPAGRSPQGRRRPPGTGGDARCGERLNGAQLQTTSPEPGDAAAGHLRQAPGERTEETL